MKFLPIVTAIIVAVVLYGFVFERETIRDLVSGAALSADDDTPTEGRGDADTATAPASDSGTGTGAGAEKPAIAVVVMESQAQEIDNTVILRGRTEADRQVDVKSEISGLIISDPKRKGSFVTKGETICEIDPGTRFADLSQAEASLAEAQINETAASRLAQGGFGSETSAASARAGLQAAQAAVARAETEIARLQITAPFDGLLETDSAELGSLLQQGASCATVIQLDPMRLVGFLPEISVNAVKLGAPAQARLSNGTIVTGTVAFVSRSADAATRTFRVDIEVPNSDLAIRDGQTADIAITADGSQAHLIPQSALTLDDSGVMGLRIVDEQSRARFVPVSIVRDTLDGILVTGLPDTARVIVIGQEYVTDGVAVEPHKASGESL